MSLEGHKRAVLQLLRDFRAFKTAYGGATELNLQSLGQYGPSGLITEGASFERRHIAGLKESYRLLEHALTLLWHDYPELYLLLLSPYLSDPADPRIVDRWYEKYDQWETKRRILCKRKKNQPELAEHEKRKPHLHEHHDRAIEELANYLKFKDLYVVYPKRMSDSEEKKLEDQNREIMAVVQRLTRSGLKQAQAIEQVAEDFGVSVDMVERIVEFRHTLKQTECEAEGCEREPFAQNLCGKHYQQLWRGKKKNAC